MRFVRAVVIILFIASFGIFGVSQVISLGKKDETIPQITSDREVLEIPCEHTQEQLLEGMQAEDEKTEI